MEEYQVFDKSILPALETNLGNNTSRADYFVETSSAYDAANIATFGIENTGVGVEIYCRIQGWREEIYHRKQ